MPDSVCVCVENKQADAGRDNNVPNLARPYSQARTGRDRENSILSVQLTTSMIVNNIQLLMSSLLKVMTTEHTDTELSAVDDFHGFLEILLNTRYKNQGNWKLN